MLLDPETWYECDRCTACCRWPGDVKITDQEINVIAEHLGLEEQEFIEDYTRLRTGRNGLSLIEKENHECIMLEKGGCRIHPVKPLQCRGFPNYWNFEGWQKQCQAKPIAIEKARELGLVVTPQNSEVKPLREDS